MSFSPYTNNGGTSVAVAGDEFVIIAADTRMSNGGSIESRLYSKITQLTEHTYVSTCGMRSDCEFFLKNIFFSISEYKDSCEGPPSLDSIAQLVSTVLYSRRFYPILAYVLLAGLDSEGKGAVWNFDVVGNPEKLAYGVQGSGQALVQPILDCILDCHHNSNIVDEPFEKSRKNIAELCRDALISGTERDTATGEHAEIVLLDKTGCNRVFVPLRYD